MTEADLESIKMRAEAEVATYQMEDLGDGVRIFSGNRTPGPALQVALDCLELVRWIRESGKK